MIEAGLLSRGACRRPFEARPGCDGAASVGEARRVFASRRETTSASSCGRCSRRAASKAGLEPNDVVTHLDGKVIEDWRRFADGGGRRRRGEGGRDRLSPQGKKRTAKITPLLREKVVSEADRKPADNADRDVKVGPDGRQPVDEALKKAWRDRVPGAPRAFSARLFDDAYGPGIRGGSSRFGGDRWRSCRSRSTSSASRWRRCVRK